MYKFSKLYYVCLNNYSKFFFFFFFNEIECKISVIRPSFIRIGFVDIFILINVHTDINF